jgi:hypothetical protein
MTWLKSPLASRTAAWYMRYQRFVVEAGFELGDDLGQVGGDPGVEVGEAGGFAFLGVNGRLIRRGVGSFAAASCMYLCATRTSLKLCHFTPYVCGPIHEDDGHGDASMKAVTLVHELCIGFSVD